jgi:hypothetical protein
MLLGIKSVGDKDVSNIALMKSKMFNIFFSETINQKATPAIAIIKVGDSAL